VVVVVIFFIIVFGVIAVAGVVTFAICQKKRFQSQEIYCNVKPFQQHHQLSHHHLQQLYRVMAQSQLLLTVVNCHYRVPMLFPLQNQKMDLGTTTIDLTN
jgi:hypothetical protein